MKHGKNECGYHNCHGDKCQPQDKATSTPSGVIFENEAMGTIFKSVPLDMPTDSDIEAMEADFHAYNKKIEIKRDEALKNARTELESVDVKCDKAIDAIKQRMEKIRQTEQKIQARIEQLTVDSVIKQDGTVEYYGKQVTKNIALVCPPTISREQLPGLTHLAWQKTAEKLPYDFAGAREPFNERYQRNELQNTIESDLFNKFIHQKTAEFYLKYGLVTSQNIDSVPHFTEVNSSFEDCHEPSRHGHFWVYGKDCAGNNIRLYPNINFERKEGV